jgi:hypothetical protein
MATADERLSTRRIGARSLPRDKKQHTGQRSRFRRNGASRSRGLRSAARPPLAPESAPAVASHFPEEGLEPPTRGL